MRMVRIVGGIDFENGVDFLVGPILRMMGIFLAGLMLRMVGFLGGSNFQDCGDFWWE